MTHPSTFSVPAATGRKISDRSVVRTFLLGTPAMILVVLAVIALVGVIAP